MSVFGKNGLGPRTLLGFLLVVAACGLLTWGTPQRVLRHGCGGDVEDHGLDALMVSAKANVDEAHQVARNFFAERWKSGRTTEFKVQSVDVIRSETAVPLIYVFNLDPPGFILVSAAKNEKPILGYGGKNSFVVEGMRPNIALVMDNYKKTIRNAIESGRSATVEVEEAWEKYITGNDLDRGDRDQKGPLLVSEMDQDGGWNDFCPGGASCGGDEVPNGCGAVSMSAIMHYWGYPVTGEGNNSCDCGGWGTQSADFGEAIYDYAAMGDATSATDAAAFLLWHAGVAVNMAYTCEGSGSYIAGEYPSVEDALKNNFLFKTSLYPLYRGEYSDAEWEEKLKNEVDAYRPFIYVGYNDEGGHAWNCDGYDGERFHMNWGWGGQGNGWFSVTGTTDPDGWGDGSYVLINIVPESLNHPNLVLTSYSSYETSGDGDAVINPGETFEFVIEMENPAAWSAATSIELLLTTEDEGVNIDESTSFFSSSETLEPGETFSNASMPFVIDLDGDIALGDKVFNLMVTGVGIDGAPDNFFTEEYELEVLVSLSQYGFPVYNPSHKTSPLVVDFDNDGDDEIIFGDYNGYIHILNSDGSEFMDDNFPFETGDQVWGAAAAADMDDDGLIDIAVVSKSKHFFLLDKNGIKVDFDSEKYLVGTPAIGNLDGDEDLEVVFSGYSSGNKIWALNADGSAVEGFPLDLGEKVKIGVALADFNGNDKDDIVVGTDSNRIHLYYDNGEEAPGFPFEVGDKVQSAPAILDMDGDKVIFAGCNNDTFYAINADGSLRFSILTSDKVFNSPAFLKHNNTDYIFFSDDSGVLYAVDPDGNALEGWPVDAGATISKSVVFADLDGDGEAEVVGVSELADALAYNLNGTPHGNFPIHIGSSATAAPMILDMDGDGDLEILAGTQIALVALDIKAAGSDEGYWSMYRGNPLRKGYYEVANESECGVDPGDVNEDSTVNILDIVQVVQIILSGESPLNECAADFNGDGTVNILDIVQIANFVLSND